MDSNHYAHGTNRRSNSNNWLDFTLSNYVFNTSSSSAVEYADRDGMSMMVGGEGRKLEDFLRASSGGVVVSPWVSNEQQQKQMMCGDGSGLTTIGDELFGRHINGVGEDCDEQQQKQRMCGDGPGLMTMGDGLIGHQINRVGEDCDEQQQQQAAVRKTVESFGQRTSVFRGVTRHRWTGRYEAHLWDNSCSREGKSRKGRQVYLGGYDKEDKAARAYDLAALKYWGPKTATNFPIGNYKRELEEMKNMSRQEFVASLRRRSSGFSRGASMYRGVTRHHQHGRWQARIGRVAGNKDLYLGTFSTQEEAAEAYDIAAIKFRGLNAVTNFDMSRYDVKSIANNNLPIGGIGNKPKTLSESISEGRSDNDHDISESSVSFAPHQQPQPIHSSLNFALPTKPDPASGYSPAIIGYGNNQITLATPSPNCYFHSTNMNIYCPSGSALTGSEPGNVGTSTMIPYNDATPTSVAMTNRVNDIGTHECISSSDNRISNWIPPSKQEYQSGNPSLSIFQTPIFGIGRP